MTKSNLSGNYDHKQSDTYWGGGGVIGADRYKIPFLLATRLGLGPLMAFLSWHGAFHGHFPCLVHYFWSYSDTRTLSRTTNWRKAWQYC